MSSAPHSFRRPPLEPSPLAFFGSFCPCLALGRHHDAVRALLKAKASVTASTEAGESALYAAAANGHDAVVTLLLDARAEANARSAAGETPLWAAAANGCEEACVLLLNAGADLDAVSDEGISACMIACAAGQSGCLHLLLHEGADPNAVDHEGRSPCFACCAQVTEVTRDACLACMRCVQVRHVRSPTRCFPFPLPACLAARTGPHRLPCDAAACERRHPRVHARRTVAHVCCDRQRARRVPGVAALSRCQRQSGGGEWQLAHLCCGGQVSANHAW